MTSSNGNSFRVTGPLCGELTGDRWILRTKASDAELWCFLRSAPWTNGWVNNREAGDLRRHRANYDGIVMYLHRDVQVPRNSCWKNIVFLILSCCPVSSDLSKIIRVLSDREYEDSHSFATSSDDLLSVSEVQEVATNSGHQDTPSAPSDIVQEATATEGEHEESISEIKTVMSDKIDSVEAKQEVSSAGSSADDISDILDLLEDTGEHAKNSN